MNPFAVIFDMDGVIVDNATYHFEAWQEACARHGITLTSERYQNELNGRTMSDTLRILFERDLTQEEIRAFEKEKEAKYRELYGPYIKPVPGLIKLLEELKEKSIPTAVATSAPPENVDFTLDGTQTRSFFQSIIDASMVSQGKPHPEVYLRSAEALETDPQRCIVFEDAIMGIQAGKNAGMKVVALATTHTAEHLTIADTVMDDFSEIDASWIANFLGEL